MSFVKASDFAQSQLPEVCKDTLSTALWLFRKQHPGVMKKIGASYHFPAEQSKAVLDFLMCDDLIKQANGLSIGMKMRNAGKASSGGKSITFEVEGTSITMTADEAREAFAGMNDQIEKLQEELEEERRRNSDLVKASGGISVVQTLAPKPWKKGGYTFIKTFDDALNDLARMIADNPALFINAKSMHQASLKVAAEANRLGILTCTGAQWSDRNVRLNQNRIIQKVNDLMKKKKPRVRVQAKKLAA